MKWPKKIRLSPTDVFPSYHGQFFDKVNDSRVVFQPVAEVSHQAGGIGGFPAVGKVIIDPQTVFLVIDQTGLFQYPEVLGDTGLGDFKGLLKLANAHQLVLKHLDNFNPVGIRKGLHHLDKILHQHHPLNSP